MSWDGCCRNIIVSDQSERADIHVNSVKSDNIMKIPIFTKSTVPVSGEAGDIILVLDCNVFGSQLAFWDPSSESWRKVINNLSLDSLL